MLADFEKIEQVEEYLAAIATGKIFTTFFDPMDISPERRIQTGPLSQALGNPFPRPTT